MGVVFAFSSLLELHLTDLTSDIMESGLAITSSNSLRTPGCISLGHIDLYTIRFFTSSWTRSYLTEGGTFLPQSCLAVHPLERCGRGGCHWDWGKRVEDLSPIHCYQFASHVHCVERYTFFGLLFLADITVTLYILAKFSSRCALAFLTLFLHKEPAYPSSSQDTCPCSHCLCISLLALSLMSKSSFSHAKPSLSDFLHMGIKSSCTLWSGF